MQPANESLVMHAFRPQYTSSGHEFRGGSIVWNPSEGSIKQTATLGPDESAITAGQGTAAARLQPTAEAIRATSYGSRNGMTEFSVEASLSAGVSANADVATRRGAVAIEATHSVGTRAQYRVVLPGENQSHDAAFRVNPFDPTTIPPGGSVIMDQQGFAKTTLEGSFRNIATQYQLVDAKGSSYAVTRLDEHHVRITLGPNRAIEAYNGWGFKTDAITAMLGRQDSLSHSKVETATFDLSNPDAQAAYLHFVSTGHIAHETPGVSDVAMLERIGYSSQTRAKFETLLGGVDLGGNQNTGSLVRATYRDGSYSTTLDLQYSDSVPLTITKRYDTEGREIPSARNYQLALDTRSPEYGAFKRFLGADKEQEELTMARLLNTVVTGNPRANGPIKPGDAVTLNFNEAQMQALLQDTRKTVEATRGIFQPGFLPENTTERPEEQSERFAQNIARQINHSPFNIATLLHRISEGADGRFDNSYKPLDAQVVVRDSVPETLRMAPTSTPITRDNPAHGQYSTPAPTPMPAMAAAHSGTTAAMSPATAAPAESALAQPVLGQPILDHERVRDLQQRLNQCGFRDGEGRELAVDGMYGRQTIGAVKAMQFQHGLEVTGLAGPETLHKLEQLEQARQRQNPLDRTSIETPVDSAFERQGDALKDHRQQHGLPSSSHAAATSHPHENPQHIAASPSQTSPHVLLDDARHRAHPMFAQGLDCMYRLDAEHGRASDERSAMMAAALVPAACEQGLKRIDQVLLSEDRNRLFAIQDPGSVHARYAWVETVRASQQPLEQSTTQADQVLQQQDNKQEQGQQRQNLTSGMSI